ncbi:MAG TPA: rhomboid family intramembrane serine protease [Vicinamibacterales bacterium]|nr:rhomboid family intramembrane serine protease [Vicinamibacterales bacterium]
MFLLLLILVGIVYYFSTPDERARAFHAVRSLLERLRHRAASARARTDPYDEVLRGCTRRPIVTPAIAALNLLIFLRVAGAGVSPADGEALVAFGASFGPRTTNGEWWRLVSAAFLNAGLFQLLINTAGLFQLGMLLERLVGHASLALVYLAAGAIAAVFCLSSHPVEVVYGASGAVLGLYGLFTAVLVWMTLRRSPLMVPVSTLRQLAPPAGLFLLYAAVGGGPEAAGRIPGLLTGFACGLLLAFRVGEQQTSIRQLGLAAGALAAVLAVCAVPLRGLADVRPEIARVLALEEETTTAYRKAVDQFRLGAVPAEALAQLIDRTIMPELQAARSRLSALAGVPEEHRPIVARADEYLRLRGESWRLRADALHGASMTNLRKADAAERASLDAFARIRPEDMP